MNFYHVPTENEIKHFLKNDFERKSLVFLIFKKWYKFFIFLKKFNTITQCYIAIYFIQNFKEQHTTFI